MSRWFHRIRKVALVVSLAGMLTNCGGGGGDDDGGTVLRLFFGIVGDGACNTVAVNVDLADAEAVLARNDDGGPDCTIDPSLSNIGCRAFFSELDDGERLRVTITGCTIPAVTNLFVCGFEDVDISDLNTESVAQCSCKIPGCDNAPPLCIDEDPDPRSCEDCDNGLDDDGNGAVDCEDPACVHLPPCVPTTTSTTTTTATEPDSTTTTVTTTTLPPEPILINFLLNAATKPLGELSFTVNYTSAPGRFEGSGESVLCTSDVDDALFVKNDRDSLRKLTLSWISLDGFDAPTALASCEFVPGTPVPVPANFTVVINRAVDTNGDRVIVKLGATVTGTPP